MRKETRKGEEAGTEARLRVSVMMRLMDPPPGSKVLLIGEGEGLLASRLAQVSGVEVTWLEGESKTEAAASPLPSRGCARLTGDFHRPGFADAGFDLVASQHLLEHLEDPGTALADWVRVLKEGGVLALATLNRLFGGREPRPAPRVRRAFSPPEMEELLASLGLEAIAVSTLLPDLKVSALYRGDQSIFLSLVNIPILHDRGRILFARAVKGGVRR